MATHQPGPEEGRDPQLQLAEALLRNDFSAFEQILSNPEVNPNHRYSQPIQGSCLEAAAAAGREDFVRVLLRACASRSVDARPTAAHRAAQGGRPGALRLLADGGEAAATDALGRTPLHYACHFARDATRGHEECVIILIRHYSPEDLNRKDKFGYSAIHIAVSSDVGGFPEDNILGSPSSAVRSSDQDVGNAKSRIVEVLLSLCYDVIDIDSSRIRGLTAREVILSKLPHLKIYLPLPTNSLLTDPHFPLIQALRVDDIDLFRAHLHRVDADCNPELDPNHYFAAPMHATTIELACSKRGGEQFVKMLLECGADPNLPRTPDMKFPIHIVCERGDVECLKELMVQRVLKVDVNARDAVGNTALHYIARWNTWLPSENADFLSCLSVLMGAMDLNVNILNDANHTPLHIAIIHHNRQFICEILTKMPFQVNLDLDGQEVNLRQEILQVYSDLEQLLPPTVQNRSIQQVTEENQLMDLLKKRKVDEFICLLNRLPRRNLCDGDQHNTPLQYASRFGLTRAVQGLLESGVDPQGKTDTNPFPPLLLASYYGHINVLRHLLESQKQYPQLVNTRDSKGNSALHYAAQRKDLESVILLLNYGANWETKNASGKMPFDGNLKQILDQCVKTNEHPPHSPSHEVIFDYRLFTASLQNYRSHTDVVNSISQDHLIGNNDLIRPEMNLFPALIHYSNGPELLNHPVTASFLNIKWSRVCWLVVAKVVNLGIYLILLNIHIVLYSKAAGIRYEAISSGYPDSPEGNERFYPNPVPGTSFPIFLSTVSNLIGEVIQASMGWRMYWKNIENIIDLVTFFLALWIVVPPAFIDDWMVHPKWSWVFVLVIMVSSYDLFLLTGRFKQFARNIELFQVVMVRYVKTFVSYFIIILAFALSFHIVFRTVEASKDSNEPDRFQNVMFTFVKVLTMMIGELDSATLPLEKTTTGTILFVVFVLSVTIVLLNLLIGVAVSDMDTIQGDAEKRWLRTVILTVMDAENFFVRIYNSWPCRLIRRSCFRRCFRFLGRVSLFPLVSDPHEARLRPSNPEFLRLGLSPSSEPLDPSIAQQAIAVLRERTARQLQGAGSSELGRKTGTAPYERQGHSLIEGLGAGDSTC